jgi:cell filamentation protein
MTTPPPGPDPYLDPASGVLRNVLGITDAQELSQVEAALTASRLVDLERHRLPGRYDLTHLRAFHRYIFGDVYDWAGQLRTVSIAKGGEVFCLPQYLESYATDVFGRLAATDRLRGLPRERFISQLAELLGDVNALHPFREGNGRTQRAFLSQASPRRRPSHRLGPDEPGGQQIGQYRRAPRRPATAARHAQPPDRPSAPTRTCRASLTQRGQLRSCSTWAAGCCVLRHRRDTANGCLHPLDVRRIVGDGGEAAPPKVPGSSSPGHRHREACCPWCATRHRGSEQAGVIRRSLAHQP